MAMSRCLPSSRTGKPNDISCRPFEASCSYRALSRFPMNISTSIFPFKLNNRPSLTSRERFSDLIGFEDHFSHLMRPTPLDFT
ncbi:hypothetical protein CEXT_237041 [Caerostris extrusa]|uniref:Uncharacterized protein n=1 Tax=Caerostris extrusa TaxID=172846 RepID=A0AAV4Y817_CAEEX|nr:hypothetical protein CEXT_237041 [Caerostris extrusa]